MMKIKKVMKGLQKASKTHAAQAKTLKGVLHGLLQAPMSLQPIDLPRDVDQGLQRDDHAYIQQVFSLLL